jgi:peptidoglycan hydrolase-like protein with peptidoglycan-binding domain
MRADISGTASRRTLRRVCGLLVTTLVVVGATGGMSAQPGIAAEATSAGSRPSAMPRAHHHQHWNMQRRFAREVTRYGDTDTDAYHIQHVYELQYRLTWAKVYSGPVTGHFGPLTRGAVKRFQ